MKSVFKKGNLLLLLLLVLGCKEVRAQTASPFVGTYSLRDGGVDMPGSTLVVLPKNEFLLFYCAGYKAGRWKKLDKNNIELTEVKTPISPFMLYGKESTNHTEVQINVYGLYRASALICFSEDTSAGKEFQPVFNNRPNCLTTNYNIFKKRGEYNWMTLTVPAGPKSEAHGTEYPYAALQYTFPLNQRYNDYVVVHNPDALIRSMHFKLTKRGRSYSIDREKELQREDLTDAIRANIEKGKKEIDREHLRSNYGVLVTAASTSRITLFKPALPPLFIAECEEEQEELADSEVELETPTNRANGFYTILNPYEPGYEIARYELALKPSITKADILSIQKVISEFGGYEIEIVFTPDGALKFEAFTQENLQKPVAIVIGGFIVWVPPINGVISDGKLNMVRKLSEQKVDKMVAELKK